MLLGTYNAHMRAANHSDMEKVSCLPEEVDKVPLYCECHCILSQPLIFINCDYTTLFDIVSSSESREAYNLRIIKRITTVLLVLRWVQLASYRLYSKDSRLGTTKTNKYLWIGGNHYLWTNSYSSSMSSSLALRFLTIFKAMSSAYDKPSSVTVPDRRL